MRLVVRRDLLREEPPLGDLHLPLVVDLEGEAVRPALLPEDAPLIRDPDRPHAGARLALVDAPAALLAEREGLALGGVRGLGLGRLVHADPLPERRCGRSLREALRRQGKSVGPFASSSRPGRAGARARPTR